MNGACPTLTIENDTHHGTRRGLASADLVLLILAGMTLATTAVLVTPHVIQAQPDASASPVETEWSPAARAAADALSLILRRSHATLGPDIEALVPDDAGADGPVILWTEDTIDPGLVNRSEVLVLEHSQLLESVTAYFFDPADANDPLLNPVLPERLVREPEALAQAVMNDAEVLRQVIAVEVLEFRVQGEVVTSGSGGRTVTPGEAWIVIRCPTELDDTNAELQVPAPLPASATRLSSAGG